MLDSVMTPGPSCPTLVLDSGSSFTAALLALPGTPTSLWPRTRLSLEAPAEQAREFIARGGHPEPECTLVCTMNASLQPGDDRAARCERRILRWKEWIKSTGGDAGRCLFSDAGEWECSALLSETRRVFGNVLGTDSGMAAALAALSLESLRDRSWNEGVTVLWAGERHIQAFMIYQEKILGLYEQHSDISRDALLADLKDLRLNWLPDEQVRAAGGHGCICGDLPAEAEGFRPTWILGPGRTRLEGCGRLVSPCGEDAFDRCFGLLYGLSLGKPA